jgi:hypothetical protein
VTDTSVKKDLFARIENLHPDIQRQLLELVKNIAPKGVEGKSLLKYKGTISPEDLEIMSKVIEENCEKVDTGEW